jgi:hypothetical protein
MQTGFFVSYDVLVRDSLSFFRAMDACLADGMVVDIKILGNSFVRASFQRLSDFKPDIVLNCRQELEIVASIVTLSATELQPHTNAYGTPKHSFGTPYCSTLSSCIFGILRIAW